MKNITKNTTVKQIMKNTDEFNQILTYFYDTVKTFQFASTMNFDNFIPVFKPNE